MKKLLLFFYKRKMQHKFYKNFKDFYKLYFDFIINFLLIFYFSKDHYFYLIKLYA